MREPRTRHSASWPGVRETTEHRNTGSISRLFHMASIAAKSAASAFRSSSTHQRRPRERLSVSKGQLPRHAQRARQKFLRIFPGGFRDDDYIELERSYKWNAHLAWQTALDQATLTRLLANGDFREIASRAVRIESRTNLLFSFEKMALRDAVKSKAGAEAFAGALHDLLHGAQPLEERFISWLRTVAQLPRRQTRVLTWPLATVFGFIAQPETHFFLKPMVTREAARRYGYEMPYSSRPTWVGYSHLLQFVSHVRSDIRDLGPRDMIDMQSFLWIQGSEEYPD